MSTSKHYIIPVITMCTGQELRNFWIDGSITAPPGFIALRRDDRPGFIRMVKVANISDFSINEKDLPDLWATFDVLPETINVKGV